ncbi:hypothetical protein Godav_003297 [Gossypium davidsonii]|uniref:Uncharacterized protein n=1 Tax=Gossypium davidsonii TaxID=34287 RepID=A0A7J8SYV1_GOSDV|nr:hypothetical protein [Gossypium davidsonii]
MCFGYKISATAYRLHLSHYRLMVHMCPCRRPLFSLLYRQLAKFSAILRGSRTRRAN